MVEMLKSIKKCVADVIKNEKNNDKVFRTKEKTKLSCHIFGVPKRYILNLRKTPL